MNVHFDIDNEEFFKLITKKLKLCLIEKHSGEQ